MIADECYASAPSVLVVYRERLFTLGVDVRYLDWCQDGEPGTQMKKQFRTNDEAVDVYRSIVEEDVDVIWTITSEGMTRVPDRAEVK